MALNSKKNQLLILDTSAFVGGFDPFSIRDKILYSVPLVREELSKFPQLKMRHDSASDLGRLRVVEPDYDFILKIREFSKETGDLNFLSDADKQILGLALQLRTNISTPIIITDDYSIQNVARNIGIEYSSLITSGIRSYLKWEIYCPACYRRYASDHMPMLCEFCGTNLRRKPLRKK